MKTFTHSTGEYRYFHSFLGSVGREKIINETIVFNTIRYYKSSLDIELFLASLFAKNGATVKILFDNGVLKHWDTRQAVMFKKDQDLSKAHLNPYSDYLSKNLIHTLCDTYLRKKAIKAIENEDLEIIFYSDIFPNTKIPNPKLFHKYAKSSAIRFFENEDLDFNDVNVRYYYDLSLENSALSYAVGKYVKDHLKPDVFITSHGIYSTWGPAFDYLKENGIKSYVYAESHPHSLNLQDTFITDTSFQTLSRSTQWLEYQQQKISPEMEQKVKLFFDSRIAHSCPDTQIYFEKKSNTIEVEKESTYQHYIAIFPNVIYDGNIAERTTVFNGIIEWLIQTLEYFRAHPRFKVYVRYHPAELTLYKTSVRFHSILQKRHPELCKVNNISFIFPEQKIDTYQFLQSGIDFGICFDGILALEMPYLKIPTLLGGYYNSYGIDGGNFVAKTKREYFNYLDEIDAVIKEFHRNYPKYYENIVRYTYWYIYANPFAIPIKTKFDFFSTDLTQLRKCDFHLNEKLLKLIRD